MNFWALPVRTISLAIYFQVQVTPSITIISIQKLVIKFYIRSNQRNLALVYYFAVTQKIINEKP